MASMVNMLKPWLGHGLRAFVRQLGRLHGGLMTGGRQVVQTAQIALNRSIVFWAIAGPHLTERVIDRGPATKSPQPSVNGRVIQATIASTWMR